MKVEERHSTGVNCYILYEADRCLRITIFNDLQQAQTRIDTVAPGGRRKGTTTALYEEAMKYVQAQANQLNKQIQWIFVTNNPKMIEWVRSPVGGLKVVGQWDQIYEDYSGYKAIKVIRPSSEATTHSNRV